MASQQAATVIDKAIEEHSDSLRELSDKIWANPELGSEEKFAHEVLTDYLEKCGFHVDRKYVIDTAFRAVYKQGDGGPNIGLICEYDALPDIGHACGHNLIAESGVAAGLGLRAALQAHPSQNGTVTVFGTPAEETTGGKIDLINGGAFDGIDICLMAHPAPCNMLAPIILAINYCTATFTGRAAHAAAAPWEGVNALDAAVNAYTALSMLRQQMKPSWRMHAVISEGGTRPNIIPERSVIEVGLRAPTDKEVGELKEKTVAIMQSAAMATGCSVTLSYLVEDKPAHYSSLITNDRLIESYRRHWQSFKPAYPSIVPDRVWASTDMGNVSQVVASIQPNFEVGANAELHTRPFAERANLPEAHSATRCVAKAMSAVGWDALTDSSFLAEAKAGFQQQLAAQQ